MSANSQASVQAHDDATDLHQSELLPKIKARISAFLDDRLQHFQQNVDEVLFSLAAKTQEESLNYLYLDTISRLRNTRSEMKLVFLSRFNEIYQLALTPQPTGESNFASNNAVIDKLLLRNKEDIESASVIKNLALQTYNQLAEEVDAVGNIYSQLGQTPSNPLHPIVMCIAWKDAVDLTLLSTNAKYVVYKLFAKFILNDLSTAYKAVIADVAQYGVAPQEPTQVNNHITLSENNSHAQRIIPTKTNNETVLTHHQKSASTLAELRDSEKIPPISIEKAALASLIESRLAKKMQGRTMPASSREFLVTIWAEAMHHIKEKNGTNDAAWHSAIQVVDDFAALTALHSSQQHQDNLLDVIPRLLCGLQNGLAMVSYDRKKKEHLFNQILTIHAHAIQNKKAHDPATSRLQPSKTKPIPMQR